MDNSVPRFTDAYECPGLQTHMRTCSYRQTSNISHVLKTLFNMSYMWEFVVTCWLLTHTHRAQLVGTLGSKAEGLALMMFFLASCTKEVASRVLQQLVHRQLSQKTPADQQHIQGNISAILM